MDNRRKVSDNKKTEILVKVESRPVESTNRNLSTSQFGNQYTEVDISIC